MDHIQLSNKKKTQDIKQKSLLFYQINSMYLILIIYNNCDKDGTQIPGGDDSKDYGLTAFKYML